MVPALSNSPEGSNTASSLPDAPLGFELQLEASKSDLGYGTRALLVLVAVGMHGLLFVLTFPPVSAPVPPPEEPTRHTLTIERWTPPPPPPPDRPLTSTRPDAPIPLPDATPRDSEPLLPERQSEVLEPAPVEWDPVDLPRELPAAPPNASEPLRPDGVNVTYPELILATRALPEYPPLARQVRAEGRVVLQVVVDRTGVIDEIEVLSSPRPDFGFTVAAREAVRQWRYHPARQQQRPVDVYLTVVVEFSLD